MDHYNFSGIYETIANIDHSPALELLSHFCGLNLFFRIVPFAFFVNKNIIIENTVKEDSIQHETFDYGHLPNWNIVRGLTSATTLSILPIFQLIFRF